MRRFRLIHGVALAMLLSGGALLLIVRSRPDPAPPPRPVPGSPAPAGDLARPAAAPPSEPAAASPATPPTRSRAREAYERLLAALRGGSRQEIREANEALRAALRPKPLRDEDNAAPIYRKAFEKIVRPREEEEQAVWDFDDGLPLTAERRSLALAYLEKNREAIALLKEAASRPRCVFSPDACAAPAGERPEVNGLIGASRLLAADALFAEGKARAELAHASARLAESMSEEPTMVAQLVGMIGQGIDAATLEGSLGSFPEESLRGMLASLAPLRMREGLQQAILGEVCMATQCLLDGVEPRSLGIGERAPRSFDDPGAAGDMAFLADAAGQVAQLLDRPYHEIRDRLESLEREKVDGAPSFASISKALIPTIVRSAHRLAATEASMGAAQLAAAASLYRAQRGSFPATLEDLATVLPDPPRDPFTGMPYRYRREGEGFVIYSVGRNGVDDGGATEPPEVDMVFRRRK